LKVAKGLISNISIFGKDWPSKDGTCIRDYIHVMDLAEGHIRTLNYLFSKKNEFINLNLGTGIGKSVLEVIETFEKTNNLKIPYVFKDRREGDRAVVVANIELSKLILNWEPSFELHDMCIHSWNWGKR
jgi:UDP-glucose 4-epimerase